MRTEFKDESEKRAYVRYIVENAITKWPSFSPEEQKAKIAEMKGVIDFRAKAWFEAPAIWYDAAAIFLRWYRLQQCRITVKWP